MKFYQINTKALTLGGLIFLLIVYIGALLFAWKYAIPQVKEFMKRTKAEPSAAVNDRPAGARN